MVVFPEPRKPVTIVMGIGAILVVVGDCVGVWGCCMFAASGYRESPDGGVALV